MSSSCQCTCTVHAASDDDHHHRNLRSSSASPWLSSSAWSASGFPSDYIGDTKNRGLKPGFMSHARGFRVFINDVTTFYKGKHLRLYGGALRIAISLGVYDAMITTSKSIRN